ncbi:hypothetical protein ACFQJC_10055 [Haloferax namakaokahaiae]|uniref:DUF7847 domain-containing protein n=1 Tax=Haloferax namakaokahaiae TaxID=1748331 RepID=A0ABD5ZFX1_9EURY
MAAISSLFTALSALRRNPVIFLGGLISGLVTLPQLATQLAAIPLVPNALQILTFFITPFVAAGIYGMAQESLSNQETSFSTFTAVGREKYVPLLLANLVNFGIYVAFLIVFGIVAIAAAASIGIGALAGGGDFALGTGAIIALGIVVLLGLAFVVVQFLIQFFPVAVVVDDAGAIEAFGDSYRLVRANIVSTLGYSIITFVAALVVATPVTGFVIFRTFQNIQDVQSAQAGGGAVPNAAAGLGLSLVEVLSLSAISLALTMLLVAFTSTYAVSFYQAHAAPNFGPDIDGDSVIPEFE